MTEDQLKHANEVWRSMTDHLRKSVCAEVYTTSDGYYVNQERFPGEIIDMYTKQLRDWHKLRAYELAEEFAKL